MKTVYFDTNVYDQLYKRQGTSDQDEEKLRALVTSRQIRILVSVTVLDEIASSVVSDGAGALERLKLVYELIDHESIVRPNTDLSYVSDYAGGQSSTAQTVSPPFEFKEWLTNPGLPVLSRIAEGVKTETEERWKGMCELFDKYYARVAAEGTSDPVPTFDQFWGEWAPACAEAIADRAGFGQECRERGIKGLLELRPALVSAIFDLSTYYAVLLESAKYKRSDVKDSIHALDSAAAQIFVTNDKRLRNRMRRKKVDDYSVVSFRELLDMFP
jgi:hypothetical protein